MDIDVKETSAWARRLTITVPQESLQKERRQVTQNLAKKLKLPGFRKGKIPAGMVEQRYGAAIEQETIERVVNRAYREAIEETDLRPITQGNIENIDYQEGTDLTFDVEFEVRPELELERVGGFKATRKGVSIDEDQVDSVLERLREDQAVWQPPEEEAAPEVGDMVKVAITPVPDEEPEEPPEPREYEIVLGDGQALPDVEDAILTLTPGDEREFTIQVPAEEDEGEEASHTVRIRLDSFKRPETPELDDNFARSLGDFEGLPELRARVREDLEKEARSEAEYDVRRQLMDQLLEANSFEVPPSMVRDYVDRLIQPDEAAEESVLDEARASARPAAERAIKRMLVIDRIAETEGLRATKEEVDARVQELAERFGQPADQLRGQLTRDGRLQQLADEITENKVYDYLESISEIE